MVIGLDVMSGGGHYERRDISVSKGLKVPPLNYLKESESGDF
jgi:hypothetical protein